MKIQYYIFCISLLMFSCGKDPGTVDNNLPVLSTITATQVRSTSFKTGGTITAAGQGSVTARGVCWGTTTAPAITGNHTSDGSGTGNFETSVTGLLPATSYYIRAYATNANGTAYGNELTVQTGTPDVYIGGYDQSGAQFSQFAIVWKNGVPTRLSDGINEARVYSVFAVDNDIYAAGYTSDYSGSFPTIWKNNTPATLSTVSMSHAYSVFVTGTDIYVGGDINGPPCVTAKLWKNGTPQTLNTGPFGSYITSVYVSGTDVYAGGNNYVTFTGYVAALWKNGNLTTLSTGSASINSIFVYNGDVYAVGYEYIGSVSMAKLWKNGTPVVLGDGTTASSANSVFVTKGDVYVAFTEKQGNIFVAKYWKNGTITSLTDGTRSASANAIAVVGNDVYVAGYESNGTRSVAKYWKNGNGQVLSDGTTFASCTSIFIKE